MSCNHIVASKNGLLPFNYQLSYSFFQFRIQVTFKIHIQFTLPNQPTVSFQVYRHFLFKIHSQFLMGAQASYRSSRSMVRYRSMFVGKWIVVLVTGGSF